MSNQPTSEELLEIALQKKRDHVKRNQKRHEPNNRYMSDIIGGELRATDIEVEERLKMLEAGHQHIDTLPYKNLLVQEHLKQLEREAQQKRITEKRNKKKFEAEKKLFKDTQQSS